MFEIRRAQGADHPAILHLLALTPVGEPTHPLREDEHWMKHTLATREDDGGVRLDYKPVIGGNYEPMERKY